MYPSHYNLENNVEHFVKRLYDILRAVDETRTTNSAQHGVRAFSLLPISHSFVPMHIVINGSTLHGICNRIFQQTEGYNHLGIGVGATGKGLVEIDVKQHKQIYLRRAFSGHRFETMASGVHMTKNDFHRLDPDAKAQCASRIFANHITTNGYSASVLLQRRKTTRDLKMDEANNEKKRSLKRRRLAEQHEREREWEALPENFSPTVYIGIDPGMRNLCTAVRVGEVHLHSETQQLRRDFVSVTDEAQIQIRTAEYRNLAGISKSQYWHSNLRKRRLDYSYSISRVPSFKTANADQYLQRLRIYWKYVSFLLCFSATNPFLKQRFFVMRMKAKALAGLAKRVVPDASSDVIVGYGNWSSTGGLRGHPPTPVKAFRRALKDRASVVPIDEHKTSKLCSVCSTPLEEALLKARIRLGGLPSQTTRLPLQGKDDELCTWSKSRDVLRCPHSECRANVWDRDVNAARNMLTLLVNEVHGRPRPEPFCRAFTVR